MAGYGLPHKRGELAHPVGGEFVGGFVVHFAGHRLYQGAFNDVLGHRQRRELNGAQSFPEVLSDGALYEEQRAVRGLGQCKVILPCAAAALIFGVLNEHLNRVGLNATRSLALDPRLVPVGRCVQGAKTLNFFGLPVESADEFFFPLRRFFPVKPMQRKAKPSRVIVKARYFAVPPFRWSMTFDASAKLRRRNSGEHSRLS